MTIHECEFWNNSVKFAGGGVIISQNTYNLTISKSQFVNNKAPQSNGGVLVSVRTTSIFIDQSIFVGNYASLGGVISTFQSSLILKGRSNTMSYNAAIIGGAIYASES